MLCVHAETVVMWPVRTVWGIRKNFGYKLDVRGSVRHSVIHKENPTRCNSVSDFIIPYLYEAQHVSGDIPPITRSLKLHWQPLVFHTWKVFEHVVGGRCQARTSSSMDATTLGGFWPALRFRSTIFYLYTSLSSFSLSSSLDPLLLGQAISVLVFLLVLMSVVPIRLLFFSNSCCVHSDYMCCPS